MSNFEKGVEFASAVGRYLASLGLMLRSHYAVEVGIGSKATKNHHFDFGSLEVLVECK